MGRYKGFAIYYITFHLNTEKNCHKRPLKKDQKWAFKTNYRLMQVKSIAGCSKGSILQYFRPSLSYHFSLRSLFCLFLHGRFRLVLQYHYTMVCQPLQGDNQQDLSPMKVDNHGETI